MFINYLKKTRYNAVTSFVYHNHKIFRRCQFNIGVIIVLQLSSELSNTNWPLVIFIALQNNFMSKSKYYF